MLENKEHEIEGAVKVVEEVVEETVNENNNSEPIKPEPEVKGLRDTILKAIEDNESQVRISQLLGKVCRLFESPIIPDKDGGLVSADELIERVDIINIGKIGPIDKISFLVVFKENKMSLLFDTTTDTQIYVMDVNVTYLNDQFPIENRMASFYLELDKIVNKNDSRHLVVFRYKDKEVLFDDQSLLFNVIHDACMNEIFFKGYKFKAFLRESSITKNKNKHYVLMNGEGNVLIDTDGNSTPYTVSLPNFLRDALPELTDEEIKVSVTLSFETEDTLIPVNGDSEATLQATPYFTINDIETGEQITSIRSNIELYQAV